MNISSKDAAIIFSYTSACYRRSDDGRSCARGRTGKDGRDGHPETYGTVSE
jgi:hypothetical protein